MTPRGADGYGFSGINASHVPLCLISRKRGNRDSLLPLCKRLGSVHSFIQNQLLLLETQNFSRLREKGKKKTKKVCTIQYKHKPAKQI